MPNLYSYRQVVNGLERLGFVFQHQRGSHIKLKSRTGRTVIVPRRREIPHGTLESILEQAGIDKKRFEALVK